VSQPEIKKCMACPAAIDSWRLRGSVLRMELRRHDLTHRELQLAELILDKTFGWQRQTVIIPQLRYFRELTGISESDTVKVLKTLHARRVIRIVTEKGHPTYSLNEDSDAWKAMPRVSKETMHSTNNLLRETNGLPPLDLLKDGEQSFFKGKPDTKNFGAGIGKSPIGVPMSKPTENDEFPNLF